MKMFDQKNTMHPEDKKNWMTFVLIGLVVYLAYDHFILQPKIEALRAAEIAAQETSIEDHIATLDTVVRDVEMPRSEALAASTRLMINNGRISGSVALKGGRIDDISLQNYFKELDKKDPVVLFSPAGSPHPRYAEFGWVSGDASVKMPGPDTVWRVRADNPDNILDKDNDVTLFWNNGQGLRFERTLSIDDNYLVRITQRVINNGSKTVKVSPYGLLSQQGMPEHFEGRFVVHEGPIGYINDELYEVAYKKMSEKPQQMFSSLYGWIGISDKYWFSSLMPTQGETTKFRFVYTPPRSPQGKARYQVDILGNLQTVAPGESIESATDMFVGAKEMKVLDKYEKNLGLRHFDLAVDFGLYYFLTKPLFYLLSFLAEFTGSFGIALICLTIIVRGSVFPLAQASFRSFARLREMAPKMQELREKYGDDKAQLQEKLVKLYEKEKVNPMAGCLPILLQIPIFFALYKVISVSIEMRHAPFFGWVNDMSAPDPTSFLNLFGFLPYDAPEFLHIGAWPCIMLMFLLLQKSLNPPPQDKTQAMMMNVMPFFITFILSQFAAGLVIYWTFSNAFSVLQQYILMRSMGMEIHLFKRSKEDKEMEELVKEGPSVHPELGVIEDELEDALFDDDGERPVAKKKKAAAKKPVSAPKPKKKKKK